MTFRQMELYIAVCEQSSISKASETNYVTQQSVSKVIRDLEGELGCSLLQRTKKGITPTECGLFFLAECRHMLERKEYLFEHITHLTEVPIENISLGFAFGVVSALPHRLIPEFKKTHERVNFEYNDQTDIYLETLHKEGAYDFCVTTGVLTGTVFPWKGC